MNKEINGEMINIPEHVAIIMDGNGRWAKKRLMPRTYGHSEGAKAIERTCENADELGIKYLTVYAFSTENWKRSVEEVSTIMNIFRKYLVDSIERSNRNNMRVRIIGKREDLPEDIVEKMDNLEKATANNTGLQFSVAINYGGRMRLQERSDRLHPTVWLESYHRMRLQRIQSVPTSIQRN